MPATEKNTAQACYGIGCPDRGRCQHYAAVEDTTEPHTAGTCDTGTGQRPRFVELQREPVET